MDTIGLYLDKRMKELNVSAMLLSTISQELCVSNLDLQNFLVGLFMKSL